MQTQLSSVTKATETETKMMMQLPCTAPAGVHNEVGQGKPDDASWGRLARTMQVQPVLLNKQDDTSFALATTASKAFSRRVQINTVGGKGSVRIKVQGTRLDRDMHPDLVMNYHAQITHSSQCNSSPTVNCSVVYS